MSRGHGKAQRFVLEALGQDRANGVEPWLRWRSASDLASSRAEREPTTAEVESIRRAIRKLGDEGLVETRHVLVYFEWPKTEIRRKMDEETCEHLDELVTVTYDVEGASRQIRTRLVLTEAEQEAEQAHDDEPRRSRSVDIARRQREEAVGDAS
jgi:hypothetical protein